MFDAVARRYDVTNTVLSLGQDRFWRLATRRAIDPKPGERILDLAAGTAVSSAPLAGAGAQVVAADFSLGMLGAAHRRAGVELVAADGLALPFADDSFDAATISFGLRNVADPSAASKSCAAWCVPAAGWWSVSSASRSSARSGRCTSST